MNRTLPLALLALAACGPNQLPDGSYYDGTGSLWQADNLTPAGDDLYAPLGSGALMVLHADGSFDDVELSGGKVRSLQPLPDGSGVAAFVDTERCVRDGRDDCASVEISSRLALIEDGEVGTVAAIASHYDTLAFAPGGRSAVAWLAGDVPDGPLGVVNLGEVDVVDLDSGERTPVRVGFDADQILFTDDGSEAVVLSQSQVAVVDLTASPPAPRVTFPLTLDPDVVVRPVGVDLTPDGRYALIATSTSGDLYVLDLVDPSVNIVSLPSPPSAMYVSESTDETLLVFAGRAELAVIDHDNFDVRYLPLDESMSRILPGNGDLVLANVGNRQDVYRYDLAEGKLTEYRLQSRPTQVELSPDGDWAVAFTQGTNGRPGMELLDLRGERASIATYALDGAGVGLAFTTDAQGATWAMVLQDGVDSLWKGELASGRAEVVPLELPPLSLGAFGDGRFFIAQDDDFGLVSFYDPATNGVIDASGFALFGVLDDEEPLSALEN